MSDYIVEQGSKGIWIYRKWYSGIAECWGQYTTTFIARAWGYIYASGDCFPSQKYPFHFIEKPIVQCTPIANTWNFWLYTSLNSGSNDNTPIFSAARGTAMDEEDTGTIQYYVIGRWK